MKHKDSTKLFSIVATILSVVALVISITYGVSICGCEINYIGVAVGLIAICATFMVGYQIWNTIDVKDSIRRNEKIAEEFGQLENKVDMYEKRSQENIDIMHSLISYQNQLGLMHDADAVIFMHHAILSALDSERDDFTNIFGYLSVFISELSEMSLTGANMVVENANGKKIIHDTRSPYNGRSVEYAINVFRKNIEEIDEQIKEHKQYYRIKREYENVMEELDIKIKEIMNQQQ